MDAIFLSALTPLYIKWLASGLRKWMLALRFYFIPRLLQRKVAVEVYLAFDDPFSYLLVQTLPTLARKYDIQINTVIVNDRQPGMNPEPKLWRQWALKDAKRIAEQYELAKPIEFPDTKTIVTAMQMWQLKRPDLNQAVEFFHQVWHQGFEEEFQHSTPVINHLIKNQQRQASLGHYSSGTVFYAGQWYQGIERLDHLERVLIDKGLGREPDSFAHFNRRDLQYAETLKLENGNKLPLECYLSIRSPYSYLGLVQAHKLAQHYGVSLEIKPVLPMKMRGLPVPKNKMVYLFLDTLRESKKLGISYGKISDPLGQGVIHCYQLFGYAKEQGKDVDFLLAAFNAVNAKGDNIAAESVARRICAQLDIDYDKAIEFNTANDWNIWADVNLQELEELGFWGVPCFKYGDLSVWGQDRLWSIEQAIMHSPKA